MHVDNLRDASRERLLAEIGSLQHQFDVRFSIRINDLTKKTNDLEMALLESRDHSRGLAAQVGELTAANEELTQKIKELRKAYERTLNSRTWKIGRILLTPVRILKRLIKAH